MFDDLKGGMADAVDGTKLVKTVLDDIDPPQRWCNSDLCACMGCVNRHYYPEQIIERLGRMITEEEFEAWKETK